MLIETGLALIIRNTQLYGKKETKVLRASVVSDLRYDASNTFSYNKEIQHYNRIWTPADKAEYYL